MNRNQHSITVGGYTDENEVLDNIDRFTKRFDNIDGLWRGVNIFLSLRSREHEPVAISDNITNALIEMFRTIANTRRIALSSLPSDIHKPEIIHDDDSVAYKRKEIYASNDPKGKQNDGLFLQIYPTICDDSNFRAILGTAINTMVLKDLIVNGYGNFHPRGTIGNSSWAEKSYDNPQRELSLWEHIESSDSLDHLHVSVQKPSEGHKDIYCLPDSRKGCLPRLWEAIKRNKSLLFLSVHMYCHVQVQKNDEDYETMIQRVEAISTMKSLSESLKKHPSIRKMELKYHRDAHQRTLLVPHVTGILESSDLHEFKLKGFSFNVEADSIAAFPINEFIHSLSTGQTQQIDQCPKRKRKLEVLRLCNIGLTDFCANALLQCLPDSVKILDLSMNNIAEFPAIANNRHSSQLRELILWKNPCLYNRDQEASLKFLFSLLLKYPCLVDLGPWDKWQFQTRVFHRNSEASNNADRNRQTSLQNLVDKIDSIADLNRCKIRLFPRNKVLTSMPSLWPIVLSHTEPLVTHHFRRPRRKLLEESSKPTKERQANFIFSILRENVALIRHFR